MNGKLTCVIVDDEPIAREGIEGYVAKLDWLECVGSFEDAMSLDRFLALGQTGDSLQHRAVDIIFIDIEMPGVTGLDYISSIKTDAAVIVITAYGEHALRGYELNVTDYLLKPVSLSRFLKAVNKARDYRVAMKKLKDNSNECESGSNVIFVKSDRIIHRIEADDICMVEGMENYVKIFTNKGMIVTRTPLKNFLVTLPDKRFMQVHKSYVVNIDKIKSIEGNLIHFDDNLSAPVSRSFKQKLFDKFTLSHSFGSSEY